DNSRQAEKKRKTEANFAEKALTIEPVNQLEIQGRKRRMIEGNAVTIRELKTVLRERTRETVKRGNIVRSDSVIGKGEFAEESRECRGDDPNGGIELSGEFADGFKIDIFGGGDA